MKLAGWITFAYGLFILIGGIMGQVKAASTLSLVIGSIFGVLLMTSGVGMKKNRLFPSYLGIILTLFLAAFFLYRFLLTFKFFPAGMISLVSWGVLIADILLIRNHLQSERKR
ncbi:MAG: hypothetical protein KR126chlam1_01423 [Chlamydiae bacterium]|nr:hypothetical protein [Chlamydiota bacterium]